MQESIDIKVLPSQASPLNLFLYTKSKYTFKMQNDVRHAF